MNFLLRNLSGLGAELQATFRVWGHLKKRCWIAYTFLILVLLGVAFLPGIVAPLGAGLLVLLLAIGGIFSGMVAKRLRSWGWVRLADGPEVVPYLSQAVTILLGPTFFLALTVLFHAATPYLPGLGATTWPAAFGLAIDNFLYTQLFFDFFECFHLRLMPRPVGAAAATLIFIVRTLLDVAFIKLAAQLIRAAYFRSLDLGRGGDPIALVRDACQNKDIATARLHSREVGRSVRAAADDLRTHREAGGPQAERAELGLRAMKDFAINHFEDKIDTQLGDERARTALFIEQLKADSGPEPTIKPIRLIHLFYLACCYLVLAGLTYVAWVAPLATSWPLSVLLALVLAWMLIRPRRWLDRFDVWRILPAGSPGWLPVRILLWLAFLTPLFLFTSAELLVLVGRAVPSAFGLSSAAEITHPGGVLFVAENLLRTQIFADTVEIYDLSFHHLQQEGLLGGTLTFLLRLVFNIGLLAVLVPFFTEQFNRLFRGLKTRPDAELLLRREARACGPQSARLVAYYFRQVRDWFVEAMAEYQDDPKILGALAGSGFVRDFQARYPEGPRPTEDPARDVYLRLERGQSLVFEGMIEEGEQEIRKAIATLETLQKADRTDLADLAAFARYVDGNLAMVRGRLPEAEVHLREAMAMIERLGGTQVGSTASGRLADLLDSLALVVGHSVARASEALGYAQQSVDLYQRLIADGQAEYREALAGSLGTRGQMLNLAQDWDPAVESLQQAIKILDELHAENEQAGHETLAQALFSGAASKGPDVRGGLAQRQLELAEIFRELRRFNRAADEASKAIVLLEALVREGQSSQRSQLARALNLLGLALNDEGKRDEARPHFEQARDLCETLILEGHGNQRELLAPLLNNLGLLLNEKDEPAEAEKHFRRAIELVRKLIDEGQKQRQELLIFVHSNLASSLMRQKRMHEAEDEVTRAVDLGKRLVGDGQTSLRDELALVLSNLGDLLTLKYQWERAVDAFRESAHLYNLLVDGGAGQYRPLRARALERLCTSLRLFGELDQAEQAGKEAVGLFGLLVNAGLVEHRGELAVALRTLGQAHHANRHFGKALARFREAEDLVGSDSVEDRLARATLLVDMARTHEAQEEHAEAIGALDRAIITHAQLVDGGRTALQADLALLLNHRANLLFNTGDLASAATAYREAVRRLKPLVDGGNKPHRQNLATFHANLAGTLVQLDEPGWPEAYQASLDLLAVLVREGDPGAAEEYFPCADAYVERLTQRNRVEEAESVLRQVADTYTVAFRDDSRNHRAALGEALARQVLGLFLANRGQAAEFLVEAETALTILEDLQRLPEPPEKALHQYREAVVLFVHRLCALPATEPAGDMARRALAFLEELQTQGRTGLTGALVEILQRKAEVHELRGETADAIDCLRQTQELLPADPFDAYSLEGPAPRLIRLLHETGRDDEAATLANQAIAALQAEVGEEPQSYEATTLATWHRQRAGLELARGDRTAAAESLRRTLSLLEMGLGETAAIARTWQELLDLTADEATLEEVRSFVEDLGEPKKYPPEVIEAVRALLDRVIAIRPGSLMWAGYRNSWRGVPV